MLTESELLKENEKKIFGIVNTFRGSGIEIEDLEQEARIAFLQATRDWRAGKASLNTLAFRYVVNALTKLCRKRREKMRTCAGLKYLDEQLADDDDRTHLDILEAPPTATADLIDGRKLFSMLTEEEAAIVTRLYVEEESARSIARDLGVAPQTVLNRYNATIDRLRAA